MALTSFGFFELLPSNLRSFSNSLVSSLLVVELVVIVGDSAMLMGKETLLVLY